MNILSHPLAEVFGFPVTDCVKEKKNLEKRLMRSTSLHWWDISIRPKTVLL